MKKIVTAVIALFLILIFLISIYFASPRTQVLNQTINNFFEKYPQIRWNTRKTLRVIESPFAFVFGIFSKEDLPNYSLIIQPSKLAKLNANLPPPYIWEILSDANKQTVNATFVADGKEYKAKVRYRGDNYNHWAFEKKSWRIELQNGYVNGMNEFNFIIPEDRNFVQSLFAFRLAHRLGLITPKSYMATLQLNNGSKGMYLLAEQWSKDTAELNTRPDTGLFLGESNKAPLYKSVYSIQTYGREDTKYVDYSHIQKLFDLLLADEKKFDSQLGTVLDVDMTLRWIAVSNAMFSRSQKESHNLVLYSNPASGLLEPVPWNVLMFDGDPKNVPINIDYNPLVTRILKNPAWEKQRNKYILQLIGDEQQLKDDINWMSNIQKKSRPAVYEDKNRLFLIIEYELQINKFKNRYTQAYYKLTENLR